MLPEYPYQVFQDVGNNRPTLTKHVAYNGWRIDTMQKTVRSKNRWVVMRGLSYMLHQMRRADHCLDRVFTGPTISGLPELERFPTPEECLEAKIRVVHSLQWRLWSFLLAALAVVLVAQFLRVIPLANLLTAYFMWSWGRGPVSILLALLVLLIPFSFMGAFFAKWLLRRWVVVPLRRELLDCGVPVCVPCGYDLRGNVTGTCPECGKRIKAK